MTGHITWQNVEYRLLAARAIWLSTTRPDGRPHAVPVWFVMEGQAIYFISSHTMQKARNLAQQTWAVLHLGDGDDTYIFEGPTTIIDDDATLQRINALYGEKYVEPRTGQHDTIFQEGANLYRVELRHVMAWIYGATDTRTDWRFFVS